MHYYNEIEPQAAAWLQALIDQHRIPEGVVDTRSIVEVTTEDLRGFVQCHFFAGIAGWPLALQLAGVPASTRLWTGSCPCQPFSVAGEGKGTEDERHLWPVFFDLIRACNPPLVFGEQVASAAVLGSSAKPSKRSAGKAVQPVWLDGVFADLESAGYACGSSDIPAAGVGAPHIRQRCWWGAVRLADSERRGCESGPIATSQPATIISSEDGRDSRLADTQLPRREAARLRHEIDSGRELESGCAPFGVGHSHSKSTGRNAGSSHAAEVEHGTGESDDHGPVNAGDGVSCGVGESDRNGRQSRLSATKGPRQGNPPEPAGFWDDSRWHPCRDGKYRRVPTQSVHEFVVNGIPALMGIGWNPCLEEIQKTIESHATITSSNPGEILRAMWGNLRTQTIQQRMGGHDSIPFPEILLIAMRELARNQEQKFGLSASDLSEMEKGVLRVLRNETGEFETSPCPSHQRGLDGSPTGESQDTLRRVPSETSPGIGSETVPALLDSRQEERNVSEALAAIQEVWRRHADESSDNGLSRDIRVGSGILVASCGFPLASPEAFKALPRGTVRPGLLKGAGNAIVPQVAAEFIKAFYEVITP